MSWVVSQFEKKARDGRAMRQTCKICGLHDKFDFSLPDEVWRAVVPKNYWARVVCLPCFDSLAARKSIAYSSALRLLFFAGDGATFTFKVISTAD